MPALTTREIYEAIAERIYHRDVRRDGQAAIDRRIQLLANYMQDGGPTDEFRRVTLHLHGDSPARLPGPLAAALFRADGDLDGEQCWDMISIWRLAPNDPWPGKKDDPHVSGISNEQESRGGRPPNKHHQYVAAVTALELAKLGPHELENATVVSIASMMGALYLTVGKKVPNERDLEKFATAVREAVMNQQPV